jgi:hypothetical protein
VAVPQRLLPRSVSALILLDNRSGELPLRHFVDVIAEKDGKRFVVSLKWQQVLGTAEQKVPFEVISLADAVTKDGFTKAYLVLGGEGWTLRAFYTESGLASHLVAADKAPILTLGHLSRSRIKGNSELGRASAK